MKKYVFILLISLFIGILPVYARSGCCSHHGGVVGCFGRSQLCSDGTLSPTCKCESSTAPITSTNTSPVITTSPTIKTSPTYISGCTDSSAINYNKSANKNDGSCQYKKTTTSTEAIPFETTYEEDSSLKQGEENVSVEGIDGLRTFTYEVVLDDNNFEVSRQEISNEITTLKVDKVIKRNTQVVEDNTATKTTNLDNKKKAKTYSNDTPASFGDVIIGIIFLAIMIGVPIFIIKKIIKKVFHKKI